MNCDITEQSLNKMWEDFSKEQLRLMGDIKTGKEEGEEKDIHKQLTQINAIMMGLIRLRNLKKKKSDNF
jgi:hypothetical protein